MRRTRSLLLILVALWLPLQAAAAWAMPFCRHAAEQAATQTVEAHCHMQMEAAVGVLVGDLDCDDCAMCHLAGASYFPAIGAGLVLATAEVFVARQPLASPSHIAEPLHHPPRRTH